MWIVITQLIQQYFYFNDGRRIKVREYQKLHRHFTLHSFQITQITEMLKKESSANTNNSMIFKYISTLLTESSSLNHLNDELYKYYIRYTVNYITIKAYEHDMNLVQKHLINRRF